MNSDIQRVLMLILRKWKIVVAVALVGLLSAYVYTANFVSLRYTSTVTFLAYVQDEEKDAGIVNATQYTASNTSKMNYAIKMIDTYIAVLETNDFNTHISETLNSKYSAGAIKNSISYEPVEETAIFKATVTTSNPAASKAIADSLSEEIPERIDEVNDGLVTIRVVDPPLTPNNSVRPNYARNCIIGMAMGLVLAVAYVLLRDILDIRIKSDDELAEKYDIPVLGAVPSFDTAKSSSKSRAASTSSYEPKAVKKGGSK